VNGEKDWKEKPTLSFLFPYGDGCFEVFLDVFQMRAKKIMERKLRRKNFITESLIARKTQTVAESPVSWKSVEQGFRFFMYNKVCPI